jgi:iron complex outermembrane receptor protein
MLLVQGRNLANEEARSHVSVLKELLPLPGRDVRLTLRAAF